MHKIQLKFISLSRITYPVLIHILSKRITHKNRKKHTITTLHTF